MALLSRIGLPGLLCCPTVTTYTQQTIYVNGTTGDDAWDGTYTGPGNKDLNLGGKAITVRSGNGPDACIIDCEDDERGLVFSSDERRTSVVQGFTITNGHTEDNGGGIACWSSDSTITDCVVAANRAEDHGVGISAVCLICLEGTRQGSR